jgi:IMP dehydrogenase
VRYFIRTGRKRYKNRKLPVVNDDYKLVGFITFRDITVNSKPIANKDVYGRLRVAATL